MTSLDFVKELVNAFNVSNYGSKVNTNFVVEGDNIVINFNCDKRSAERYLSQMARDLVREYFSDESVARHAFDLGSLPFDFDEGRWTHSKAGTQLTVPIDSGVIFNLKVHFAEEFKNDVKDRMIKAIDEKNHLGKKSIEEALNKSIKQVKMDPSSGYIKCLLFNSTNVQTYFVGALQAKMQEYGYNYLNFYDIDYKNKKIYFKDVENIGFVRSVTELYKERSGYYFRFPSDDDLKVRKYKDAMGDLIFDLTKIPIYGYYRDNFIDEGRISNGDRFAFIPITKDGSNFRYLNYMEADKINAKFSHDLFTNVRGQTKDTKSDEFGEVYALSDRQIALLIPIIIENSVINKDGQIEINPELPRTLLTESSLTRGLPTRGQGDELGGSPRRGPMLPHMRHHVGAADVVAAQNVQASTNIWTQKPNPWLPQSMSGNKWQPSPEPGPSGLLWNKSESAWPSASKVILEKRPASLCSIDSGKGNSLERPKSSSSITTSAVPGISESGEDPNVASVPVDNKRPQLLPLAGFSTCASNKTVKAFLCFLDHFSSPEGKKQLPLFLSSEAGKQLSSISDPREQEELLDFLFSTEGNKQLCSLFSSENKQQLHLLFSLSPEGQKLIPLVLSPEGKEQLPLLLSPEGERISKPFSPEAGNIISLLIDSRVEPKNMSHRSFRDKLAKWLHRNSSLSKVASPQEKPLTNDEKKELRPFLCPKLQKKLDSNSLEDAQLKYLLYTSGGKKKLDLLLSSPEKEGKQLYSDLPFEAKKELLPEFFDKQGISCNASTSSEESGIFSGSSSQKSTSDEDELEDSGRSSVSSNSSTSTVRTTMDSLQVENACKKKLAVVSNSPF